MFKNWCTNKRGELLRPRLLTPWKQIYRDIALLATARPAEGTHAIKHDIQIHIYTIKRCARSAATPCQNTAPIAAGCLFRRKVSNNIEYDVYIWTVDVNDF
jgi:hypothetical protein